MTESSSSAGSPNTKGGPVPVPAPGPVVAGHCCPHMECSGLRDYILCKSWFLMKLTTAMGVQCDELADFLDKTLYGTRFQFRAVVHIEPGLYTYFVLLKLRVGSGGQHASGNLAENLVGTGIDATSIRLWRLKCCVRVLRWNVPVWLHHLRAGKDALVFPQQAPSLVMEFEEDVRAALAVWDLSFFGTV